MASQPATIASTAAPSSSAAMTTSSPASAAAIDAMSLTRSTRASGRKRGRSSRPRPPAAPVSSRRSNTRAPDAGADDDGAVLAGDTAKIVGERAPRRIGGCSLAQSDQSSYNRPVTCIGNHPAMNESAPTSALPLLRRPRNLALTVVDALADRIRDGRLAPGAKLATESALMAEFGVSRTVIREALSKLQAAALVHTRHGVGTFVTHGGVDSAVFRIRPDQLETLHDVVAMLELRIGVETEAAGLAAQRRGDDNLAAMRRALIAFTQAVEAGRDAVGPDFQFHVEIARATQNPHFSALLQSL